MARSGKIKRVEDFALNLFKKQSKSPKRREMSKAVGKKLADLQKENPEKFGPLRKKAEMTKVSETSEGLSKLVAKHGPDLEKLKKYKIPAIAAGSIIGYDQLRKAKRDWETGRAMRYQSGY